MKCDEIEKYLPLFPDDIDQAVREEVEIHIRSCDKCGEMADKLTVYKYFVKSEMNITAPEGFEMKVLKDLPVERKFIPRKQVLFRFGVAVSSAAILLAAFIILKPNNIQVNNIIETNFALRLEKKGKGPSESFDMTKIDNAIMGIISETKASVEEYKNNPVIGYYDYILIGVPNSNLKEFIEKFNHASAIPIEIPKGGDSGADKTYLKVYFDMVNFAVGDYNGDKRADIIAQFMSGKHKGKWMMYKNDTSVHFNEAYTLKLGNDGNKFLGDYWIISGDFNGDRYDDICLYEYSGQRGLTVHALLNNRDNSFREVPEYFTHLSVPVEGDFVKIISGDADGNGSDDLIWIAGVSEGSYRLTAININKPFGLVNLPDLKKSGGVIIAGDLNGDNYFDLCVKYPGMDRGGETEILLNNRNFTFDKPYIGRLSFQGDYIFWCDDYNGDGFDDLYVKSGGPFISGSWYILPNNLKADFFRESRQFTVAYPGEVK